MENPFLVFSPFFILNHLYAFIIFKMLIQFIFLGFILLKTFDCIYLQISLQENEYISCFKISQGKKNQKSSLRLHVPIHEKSFEIMDGMDANISIMYGHLMGTHYMRNIYNDYASGGLYLGLQEFSSFGLFSSPQDTHF